MASDRERVREGGREGGRETQRQRRRDRERVAAVKQHNAHTIEAPKIYS